MQKEYGMRNVSVLDVEILVIWIEYLIHELYFVIYGLIFANGLVRKKIEYEKKFIPTDDPVFPFFFSITSLLHVKHLR